jgi:Cu(I)/Ag(I) efflux system periplasmic protein CusF
MKHTVALFASLLFAAGTSLTASADDGHSKHHAPKAAPAATDMADAEVRKVDKENKKLTLKHGEIKNLDMPPMTMVFQVQDAAWLEQVKAGDRIRFKADRIGGSYTVTAIEIAK